MVEDHHSANQTVSASANFSNGAAFAPATIVKPATGELENATIAQIAPQALISPPKASSSYSSDNFIDDPLIAPASPPAGDSPHGEPMTSDFQASNKAVKTPLISRVKFDWSHAEQGHILGAFFYGYILFQVPGARMAESVGAKWILMAANAGSALISLAFPLSTQLNSIHLLMVLRFVMGCCQSAFFPASYVLFCRWLPEKERAVLLPVMFIGSNMGSISTYIMSSYLITSSHGWPSVFYLSGFVCSVVTVLWCVCGSNGPEDNSLITKEELAYIQSNVETSHRKCAAEAQPLNALSLAAGEKADAVKPASCEASCEASWSKLLKSVPVWTLILR